MRTRPLPGTFHAVYNGTKVPGVTDTEFFERADLMDTAVGQDENKDDPADVAKAGFDAMMRGEGDVVSGWKNRIQTTMANVTPSGVLAEQHRKMTEPGSAEGPKEKVGGRK